MEESLNPVDDQTKVATSNDDGVQKIMEILKGNMTIALDQTMYNLDSMLLLKGHRHISDGLRSKIESFADTLIEHLESDLSIAVSEYKSLYGIDPLSAQDSYEFSINIQQKWEDTLSRDIVDFQETTLPKFVTSIKKVWHGVERKVMSRIEKFEKFMHKNVQRTSTSCSVPKPLLSGFNHLNSVFISYSQMLKKSVVVILAEIALIAAAVTGVIALATAGPLLLLFVALWVFKDHLAYRIHGPI